MTEKHIAKIAQELQLKPQQILATATLIEEGATVPFVARYRKEVTGSLDEVAITTIRDRLHQLREIDKRKEAIVKSLDERQLLTKELSEQILAAETMAVLEDIYLPYRPKRRTRATVAREMGLEPLAQKLFAQEVATNPLKEAEAFVDPEKGLENAEDGLAGARDIIAEWVNEDQAARTKMRAFFAQKALFRAKVISGKETEGSKYRDYFDWEETVTKAPSNRIMAMLRGEKEGVLTLRIHPPEDEAMALLFAAKIDVLVADYPFCALSAFRYPDKNLHAGQSPLTFEPLGIAMAEDTLLINWIENFMLFLQGNGELKKLHAKWLNDGDWIQELP